MPGLIYIFWHIFIVNYVNNKFPKYQEFVGRPRCSKLYFSAISYICPCKFLSLYLTFSWKIEWKIKICAVRIIHMIKINRILVVIFMDLEKSSFVLFILNPKKLKARNDWQPPTCLRASDFNKPITRFFLRKTRLKSGLQFYLKKLHRQNWHFLLNFISFE